MNISMIIINYGFIVIYITFLDIGKHKIKKN